MRILALETSAKAVSAAVAENGKLLAAGYQDTGLTHSRTLLPMVEHLLENAGLSPADMDAFAVAAGPGSFTGIRIGVATAKGLAFGTEKPCIGVSTLAAMARNVSFAGGLVVCAMDARRSQIYNALFQCENGEPVRLTKDRAIGLDALAAELAGDTRPKLVTGDGAALCAEFLRKAGIACRTAPAHLVMQNAAAVALEAQALAVSDAGALVSARELRPFYPRPPHAVPPKSVRIQP